MMENQPEKQERKILEVTLLPDNQIQYKIYGSHIPTLTYVLKLLDVAIEKMIIDQQIKTANPGGIIVPKKHKIIDFIRGKAN
jgi:hypothetical protein